MGPEGRPPRPALESFGGSGVEGEAAESSSRWNSTRLSSWPGKSRSHSGPQQLPKGKQRGAQPARIDAALGAAALSLEPERTSLAPARVSLLFERWQTLNSPGPMLSWLPFWPENRRLETLISDGGCAGPFDKGRPPGAFHGSMPARLEHGRRRKKHVANVGEMFACCESQ